MWPAHRLKLDILDRIARDRGPDRARRNRARYGPFDPALADRIMTGFAGCLPRR